MALSFTVGGAMTAAPVRAAAVDGVGTLKVLSLPTTMVRPWHGSALVRTVLVYTPIGYNDPANAGRRYAVVYLLHGSPGNPYNFLKYGAWPDQMEDAARAGQSQQVILVMPDGNYAGQKQGDSEWANSPDRRDHFEDWLVREVVPYIDSHYRTRTDAADRILAGVSEGGLGSVNLALHNSRMFGGAIGLSGYYDMRGFGWGHIIMQDNDNMMALNSPLFYVPERQQMGLMPPDWRNLKIFVGAGGDEHPYTRETKQVADVLKAAGLNDVTLSIGEGKHDWNLWTQLFLQAMHLLLPAGA
jgi:enterochelin esterase-like enzyme